VLFGSIHALPPGLDWRPPALNAALAKADDLWLEIPSAPDDQAQAAALVAPLSTLPPGQTLDSKLSPAGRKRLAKAVAEYALSNAQLQTLRPWMAEVVLSAAQAAKDGGSGAGGVEQSLSNDPNHPPRLMAFETLSQQVQMFAGPPEADQVASLEDTLKDLDGDPRAYDRLVKAWMAGDLKALQREVIDPVRKAEPAAYKRLVLDRNADWIVQLRNRLAGSGRTVVVVGAGHLLGPQGLPARLRALGYQVDGPK
jgi:uncharacterized protein YbaP (TraB family)